MKDSKENSRLQVDSDKKKWNIWSVLPSVNLFFVNFTSWYSWVVGSIFYLTSVLWSISVTFEPGRVWVGLGFEGFCLRCHATRAKRELNPVRVILRGFRLFEQRNKTVWTKCIYLNCWILPPDKICKDIHHGVIRTSGACRFIKPFVPCCTCSRRRHRCTPSACVLWCPLLTNHVRRRQFTFFGWCKHSTTIFQIIIM